MKDTKEAELLNALTTAAKTAAELKAELNLRESSKMIGKALCRISETKPEIEVGKYRGVHQFSIKKNITVPTPTADPPKQKVTTNNLAHNLETLIHELKEEGINVQEVCYIALRDKKEKIESELRFVKENAPTFKESYDKLKEQLHQAMNQLQDFKDMSNKMASKKMINTLIEQRRAGIN